MKRLLILLVMFGVVVCDTSFCALKPSAGKSAGKEVKKHLKEFKQAVKTALHHSAENLKKIGAQADSAITNLVSSFSHPDIKQSMDRLKKLEDQCIDPTVKAKLQNLHTAATSMHTQEQVKAFVAKCDALENEIIEQNSAPSRSEFCFQCIGIIVGIVIVWYWINNMLLVDQTD
jgi:hypothetical protein